MRVETRCCYKVLINPKSTIPFNKCLVFITSFHRDMYNGFINEEHKCIFVPVPVVCVTLYTLDHYLLVIKAKSES